MSFHMILPVAVSMILYVALNVELVHNLKHACVEARMRPWSRVMMRLILYSPQDATLRP